LFYICLIYYIVKVMLLSEHLVDSFDLNAFLELKLKMVRRR